MGWICRNCSALARTSSPDGGAVKVVVAIVAIVAIVIVVVNVVVVVVIVIHPVPLQADGRGSTSSPSSSSSTFGGRFGVPQAPALGGPIGQQCSALRLRQQPTTRGGGRGGTG